jgi:Uma2 family endonuclease
VAVVTHPVIDAPTFVAIMEEAGWRSRSELLRGEVVVSPPTGGTASVAQTELAFRLRAWQERTGDEGLVLQDVFVRLGDEFLAPDVAWWSAQRRPAVTPGALAAVPDLVVEVLSPATRANDLGPKREAYEGAGARELWLVDPEKLVVRVARPAGAEVVLGEGDLLASDLLPGFELAVAAIFAPSRG